ncbi:MAG: ATP-binding protein [Amaricoccus sp.]|uniref:ATP-binding protein n=1 Tax=Amaricoccus sp. TaxID=1872485 RepID=UPI0039E35FA6
MTPLLRSATLRLILVHLVLVALSTGLVLGFLYWRVGGVIDDEQRAVVDAEISGLLDDYARGNVPALAAALQNRLAIPHDRDAIYLLADADGHRIAGNLAGWPATLAPGSGWARLSLYRTDRSRPTEISARAVRLPQGELLLVGRDVAARAAFDRTLGRALLWALAAILTLAVATGWFLSRLVRGRIAEVDGAARAIMAGRLDRRIGLRGTGDEFDQLAGTLNAMLDRIEILVSDLRTVTDSLAHDLRTPLGRLVRHLEGAADEAAPAESRQRQIESALGEAEDVLSTATALLDISRIDAGLGADQFSDVDLGRLAADVSELYEAAAEDRGLRIAVEAKPGLRVRGHDQILALAVSNLVDNALKHAPAGSTITVSTESVTGAAGVRPSLVVADEGPGIPAADRSRALGRFVRLDPSRSGPGTGLGLALVASVARMHGASIELGDNHPGLRAALRFPATTPG